MVSSQSTSFVKQHSQIPNVLLAILCLVQSPVPISKSAITLQARCLQQPSRLGLEVRYPAIVAPISRPTPPQRLVLGSCCFASLWVSFSLELRQNPSSHIRMQLFPTTPCLYLRIYILNLLFYRGFCSSVGMRRLIDLRPRSVGSI